MRTECGVTRRLFKIQADARLEPLPITIDERNKRDRDVECATGDARNSVETFFGRSVEDIEAMKRSEALSFIGGFRCSNPATALPKDRSAYSGLSKLLGEWPDKQIMGLIPERSPCIVFIRYEQKRRRIRLRRDRSRRSFSKQSELLGRSFPVKYNDRLFRTAQSDGVRLLT